MKHILKSQLGNIINQLIWIGLVTYGFFKQPESKMLFGLAVLMAAITLFQWKRWISDTLEKSRKNYFKVKLRYGRFEPELADIPGVTFQNFGIYFAETQEYLAHHWDTIESLVEEIPQTRTHHDIVNPNRNVRWFGWVLESGEHDYTVRPRLTGGNPMYDTQHVHVSNILESREIKYHWWHGLSAFPTRRVVRFGTARGRGTAKD